MCGYRIKKKTEDNKPEVKKPVNIAVDEIMKLVEDLIFSVQRDNLQQLSYNSDRIVNKIRQRVEEMDNCMSEQSHIRYEYIRAIALRNCRN